MTFHSSMPRVWPIVAAVLLALTACESSDTTQDDTTPTSACASVECADDQTCDEATGECISTAEPECVSDSDCNDSTLACIEGVCVSKCEGVTCPDGQVCDPTSGGCLQDYSCSSDGDCPDGMTCGSNGLCGLPARSDCTGGLPCAEGLTCVNGPVSLCVPPCESNNDCGTSDFCVTSENVPIAPFAGYIGYCLVNGCQPGGDGFGFAQDAPNFGPCSDRAGNPEGGVCLPDAFTGLGLGICFAADGPAGNGEACDPFANWGSDQVCSPGLFCNPFLFDGTCSQFCNVYDDETCEQTDYFNGLNDNACLPVVGGDGICIPSLGGADGGETCTPSPDAQLALCQDNYGCGPSNLDRTEFSCNPWCDPATDGVSATYCGEGEYCWTETDEAAAGVCAPSACTSEVQCGEGEICDNDSGGCIDILESGGCISDTDCGAGTVCENNTCVVGRLGDCGGGGTCAAGLACVSAAGGAISLCLADCSDNNDCDAIEYCATGDNISMNSQLNLFLGAFEGKCMPNVCSPTVTSSDQAIAFNAEYMGACSDRHGNADAGVCFGPQGIAGERQGICVAANGPLALGEACNAGAGWGDSDLCGSGALCPIGIENPVCTATCNALSGPECAGSGACFPLFDAYGLCADATGAAAPGEACDLADATAYPCQHGYGCAPSAEGQTEGVCRAFCDPAEDGATATFCSETDTCFVYDPNNPGIGICIPAG